MVSGRGTQRMAPYSVLTAITKASVSAKGAKLTFALERISLLTALIAGPY